MHIVLAEDSLAWLGGTQTYTLTVAEQLQRLAHDVLITTREQGVASELAAERRLRVLALDELPDEPAVALTQDAEIAYELARRRPQWAQVIVVHSDIFDIHLPPAVPQLRAAIALYDRVERRLRAMDLGCPVVRLSQPVDVERFKPAAPLRERDPVVLLLGNYMQGERLALIEGACAEAGLRLRHVGVHGEGPSSEPEVAINAADIVIGKARVIFEALACGRAAYVYDHNGGEGWVTAANVARLAADNFGGQSEPIVVDGDHLTADLAGYDPAFGLAGRDHVVAHHAASAHAAELVDVLRAAAGEAASASRDPFFELARMARLYAAADSERFALRAGLETQGRELSERVRELDEQLAAAVARVAEVEARAVAAETEAGAAGERARAAEAAHAELVATRRWRALQRVVAPVDRLRGRR